MSVFLFKRLFTFLATLAVASVLVFAVLELLPGNVAQVMLGETATPESIAALEKKLGLDQPPLQRYTHWVAGLLQGRTANSFSYDTPTAELIAERLQVTVPLGMLAMELSYLQALTESVELQMMGMARMAFLGMGMTVRVVSLPGPVAHTYLALCQQVITMWV